MEICFRCQETLGNQAPVHGLHKNCFIDWFKLAPDSSTEFGDVVLRQEIRESGPPINASFFQGKFKKYSATLGKRSYILKVQDKDYPELPRVEYLSNQIAKKLGLNVPEFYIIRFLNEMDVFVVHNFMEDHVPGNLIHIYHFVKAAQSFSCKTILDIIEKKIGRIEAMKQFVFLCLFDALIGNHDRHGRNMAFIETRKGLELAPFYDNPSYIGIEDKSFLLALHNPRGKIVTSLNNEPTMEAYVSEFHQMEYGVWLKEFREQIDAIHINQLVEKSFVSEKRKTALSSLINRRIEEFDNANLS